MIGPLPWIGGKRRIAKQLAALLPPHVAYVEPFCGGAQLFFNKPRSRVEVLNDLDGELINFLRVCQLHHPELVRFLSFTASSRRWFDIYAAQDPTLLTDVQRAARFYFVQKHSFAGRPHHQNFNYAVSKSQGYKPERVADILGAVAERLQQVQLESLPYEEVLRRYDRTETVFYLDPPYVKAPWYRFNFQDADFGLLAERLRTLKGRFLLSINDHPIARAAFSGFHCREISFVYTATPKVPNVRELMFSNYTLPEPLNSAA